MTKDSGDTINVYQWNCRSLNNKRSELAILAASSVPDIIALQETNTPIPRLPYYTAFTQDPQHRTAIFVHNTHPAQTHQLSQEIPNTFVELISTQPSCPSTYVLNIYSPPKGSLQAIDALIHEATQKTKNEPFLLVGDFNAPHYAWGYVHASKKGTALLRAAQNHHLTLQNDLTAPTRIGNSVNRDTIPDLTFTRNCQNVQWFCLPETLGSDHHIVSVQLSMKKETAKRGVAKLTNWSAFREDVTPLPPIQADLTKWTQALEQRVQKYTREIALTEDIPAADTHLLNIWEARRSLTKRLKHNKYNRTLKKRIALLTRQAQDYATTLRRQNWHSFCDKLKGTLSTKKTWHLLRHLLDSSNSRTQVNHKIQQLIRNSDLHPRELLRSIRNNLFGTPTTHPDRKSVV